MYGVRDYSLVTVEQMLVTGDSTQLEDQRLYSLVTLMRPVV